jgi:hypothetical protein
MPYIDHASPHAEMHGSHAVPNRLKTDSRFSSQLCFKKILRRFHHAPPVPNRAVIVPHRVPSLNSLSFSRYLRSRCWSATVLRYAVSRMSVLSHVCLAEIDVSLPLRFGRSPDGFRGLCRSGSGPKVVRLSNATRAVDWSSVIFNHFGRRRPARVISGCLWCGAVPVIVAMWYTRAACTTRLTVVAPRAFAC